MILEGQLVTIVTILVSHLSNPLKHACNPNIMGILSHVFGFKMGDAFFWLLCFYSIRPGNPYLFGSRPTD
jgi:hypothetical protein